MARQPHTLGQEIRYKLLRWVGFNICVALLPLSWIAIRLVINGEEFSLVPMCARGELLLIASAIAAAAIGELIGSDNKLLGAKLSAAIGCTILVLTTTGAFFQVSETTAKRSAQRVETDINDSKMDAAATKQAEISEKERRDAYDKRVSKLSLAAFVATLVAAGSAVILAEIKHQE